MGSISSLLFLTLCTCINRLLAQELIEKSPNVLECPTWYIPAENGTHCVCGSTVDGELRCLEDQKISIVTLSCMTYTEEQTLIGLCPYAASNSKPYKDLYNTLPKNVSQLNDFMCGGLNRTGLLCSQCRDNLTLAALSYTRECIECSDADVRKGIVLFIVFAFIPTTAFFLLVMICRIDIASGSINVVVTIIQILTNNMNQNPSDYVTTTKFHTPVVFLVTFLGIWNLDFLSYVIPSFCISKSLTHLQTVLQDYAIAVYPLLLILITYICVELYDKEYYLIVMLWKPFRKIGSLKYFKNFDIKSSLITTFATFFQLVYTRIFFISKEIWYYTELTNNTGNTVRLVLQIDASVTFFSSAHIPYIALAVLMLIIFNLLPLLLLFLYPTKCFQHFLGCFPNVNWHPLRAFMDIFQGCYKNGTDGTRDCRYFAALNFAVRMLILVPAEKHSIFLIKMVLVSMIFCYMLAYMRPYQKDFDNFWATFCYFMFTLSLIWLLCAKYDPNLTVGVVIIGFSSILISFVYFCLFLLRQTLKMLFPGRYAALVEKLKDVTVHLTCMERNVVDMERGNLDEASVSSEDKDNNHKEYCRPLLPSHNSPSHNHKVMIIASYGIARQP